MRITIIIKHKKVIEIIHYTKLFENIYVHEEVCVLWVITISDPNGPESGRTPRTRNESTLAGSEPGDSRSRVPLLDTSHVLSLIHI